MVGKLQRQMKNATSGEVCVPKTTCANYRCTCHTPEKERERREYKERERERAREGGEVVICTLYTVHYVHWKTFHLPNG